MVAQTIDRLYQVKAHTVTDWRTRALQLAESHGLARTGRGVVFTYATNGVPTTVTVRVASQSQADSHYDVVYEVATDSADCLCSAAKWGKPCAHAGEGLRYGRSVVANYAPDALAEAERMAQRDAAHAENTQALGF